MTRLQYGAGLLRVSALLASGRTGTCKALAAELDMRQDTTNYHLKRLAADGFACAIGTELVRDFNGRACQHAVVWGVPPASTLNIVEHAMATRTPLEAVWVRGES
jgi:DNA-binding transcriptional ArsR family regulator